MPRVGSCNQSARRPRQHMQTLCQQHPCATLLCCTAIYACPWCLCSRCRTSLSRYAHSAAAVVPWQVLEEDHPLAAALLQNAAAPYGAADCEATASAGPSLQTSSSTFCNSFHGMAGRRRLHQAWEVVHEVVLPMAILLIGVGFSVAALYVALLPLLQ